MQIYNAKEDVKSIKHDYTIGTKVMFIDESVDHKAMDKYDGPFPVV